MLGIGNVVTAGSKVASVVRKGLVAWYKGNQIQSPTGEELVSNPDFSLESAPDLLDHNNWYRNTTTPTEAQIADGPDFIAHGNTPDTPIPSGTTGVTLTEHGFRYKTTGSSIFISMAQSNIMNSAVANEETLMLTYDILQNSGSGELVLAMSSNDISLDVTVGPHVMYFIPTTNTFQIKRGQNNVDITIANIKLRKTNPGNKWGIQKLASQDMDCSFDSNSDLINHPANTNIKVGMKVQGSKIPSGSVITAVNVNGSNTQFRINKTSTAAQTSTPLRIRAASTVHVKDGEVEIDYVSSDANSTGVAISNIVNHDIGQKYRAEVDVKSISASNALKVQIGSSPGVYNLVKGLNVFEYVATGQSALYVVRSQNSTSVQAVVTRVSLKKVEPSVRDVSSQANDAELYTGACLNFTNGVDNGIDLGILDNTTLGSTNHVATDPQLTIATWFKADTLGGRMIFSTGHTTGNDTRLYLWTDSNKLELGFGNNSGSSTNITGGNSVPTLEANRWYRVVVVLKGPVANLYLDGEYKYSKVSTVAFTTEDNIHLGINGNASSPYYFDGQISDFQVYDTAWNQEDVAYDFADPNRDVFERVNATEYLGQDELAGKSDSDWIDAQTGAPLSGSGWSVSNGVLTYDGTLGGNYKATYIPFNSVPGAEYEVSITMTNHITQTNSDNNKGVNYGIYDYAAGLWTVRPYLNSSNNTTNWQQTRITNGTHTFRVITNNRRNAVRIQSNNGSATTLGEISNVTIKRVHHVSVQPADCLAIYRLNEYYGGRIFNSAPILGEELIFNNDFSNGTTGWSPEDSGATIEVGTFKGRENVAKINILGTDNNDRIIQEFDRGTYAINGDGFKQNTFYSVEVDVFVESGDFRFDTPNGDIDTNFITTSVTGSWQTLKTIVKSESTAGAADPAGYVWLRSVNTVAEIYVDKVSFKEIKPPNSQVIVNDGTIQLSGVAYDDNSHTITHTANSKVTPGMTVIGDHVEAGSKVLSVTSNTEFVINRKVQTPGDASQTGQTLTLTKFVSGQPHIPQFGLLNFSKKVFFDGIDDWASNANSLSHVSRLKDYSVSLWVVPYSLPPVTNPETRRGLFQNSQSATDRNGISIFPDGTIRAGHWGDTEAGAGETLAWTSASSDSSVELGKLYHVVFTNEAYTPGGSNGTKLYINGVLQSGTISAYTGSATGIYIGKNTNGTERTNSLVDEVSVFNKTLSQSEVQEIFNSGTALDVRDISCYYSSELILNGDIATSQSLTSISELGTNVTKPDSIVVAGGLKLKNDPQADAGTGEGGNVNDGKVQFGITEATVTDSWYQLSYDVVENNGCTTLKYWYGTTYKSIDVTQHGFDGTEVGTHTLVFKSNANSGFYFLNATNDSNIVLNNISLKRIYLSGYWRNNGLDTWNDLSLNSNDCTVSGSPSAIYLQELPLLSKDVLGLPMNRVRRNGLNLEFGVAIADPAPVRTSTDAITVEAWVYPRQIGAVDQAVVGTRDNTSYLLYRQRNSNYYRFYVNGGTPGDNMAAQTSALDFNKWYHIVAVYDKTRSKEFNIYVNGDSNNVHLANDQDSEGFSNPVNAELNESVDTTETELYIGKYADANFHGGIIDDVKIYDRRLSLSEIKRNYNATKGAHKNLSITWSDDFSEDFG